MTCLSGEEGPAPGLDRRVDERFDAQQGAAQTAVFPPFHGMSGGVEPRWWLRGEQCLRATRRDLGDDPHERATVRVRGRVGSCAGDSGQLAPGDDDPARSR